MHFSKPVYTLIAGALSLTISPQTQALRIPWTIRRAQSGVFVGIGYGMGRYQETMNAAPVDSESGGLSVYTVGLSHIGRRDGSLYAWLRFTGAFGTTHYQGNSALGLPAQGSTTNRMATADGRLGLVIDDLWRHDRDTVLIPYIGAGFHREARTADPGTGNPGGETSTDGHIGIGLGVDYAIDRRVVLTLHALTGYTVGAQITTTEPIAFDVATQTLETARVSESLGDRPYNVLDLAIHYRVDDYLEIAFAVRRATWSAAGSAPIPIAGVPGQTLGVIRIPGSQSAETTMLLQAATPF